MKQKTNPKIERHIIIGMVVSDEYLAHIRKDWKSNLLKSSVAKRLAKWCIEYYDKYKAAPHRNMESIYLRKIKEDKLPNELAEEIEQDILPSLSEEYEHTKFNLPYLLDQTRIYFAERRLELLMAEIDALLAAGNVEEAEKLAQSYKAAQSGLDDEDVVDLSSEDIGQAIEQAFAETGKPLFEFPGAFGEMVNRHLVRGGFIALLAPEKRGKSFQLLEFGVRASKAGCNVAFFQAGDMTRSQQLRRICIHRAKRSDDERYCGERYIPVKDCIHNQLDTCDKPERECDFGLFIGSEAAKYETFEGGLRKNITMAELREKVLEMPEYKPCSACRDFRSKPYGTPWLQLKKACNPLEENHAKKIINQFFVKKNRRFKLSTHPNGTLTVAKMEQLLDKWEQEDGFIADVVITDYGDLLVDDNKNSDERSKQNNVWKALRGLSQKKHHLEITVTQADAASYSQDSLKLTNFSEDKRKYAHVTAMWGMNQDPKGREKELGILRIGELVIREGDFNSSRQVTILQDLASGQPFMTSYW